jgi:hypothetical protein
MGKLIKNHWARLIILTAAAYQIAAALEGFFWRKVFWDFATKNLDGAVKRVPVLQILNLLLGIAGLFMEWPLWLVAGSSVHRSIEARLVVYPLSALLAVLLYQATNPAIYYLVGVGVYFWAYSEGEVCRPFSYPIYISSALRSWLLPCPKYRSLTSFSTERIRNTVDITEEKRHLDHGKGLTCSLLSPVCSGVFWVPAF